MSRAAAVERMERMTVHTGSLANEGVEDSLRLGLPPPALWYGVVEFAIPRRTSLDGLRKQPMIGRAGWQDLTWVGSNLT